MAATLNMRGIITVDCSHALGVVTELYSKLGKEKFNECLEITVKDTGRQVKKIIKQEIPKEYEVTSTWVGSKVRTPKYSGGGGSISCVIPVRGERGTLGGIFPAGGGNMVTARAKKNGKALKKLKKARSGVTATILKGKSSSLPGTLPNQGGNPPFRLPNKGVVLTRSAKKALVRVAGRAVPQMVDKHFEDRLQEPINDYMIKRMGQVVKWKMGI